MKKKRKTPLVQRIIQRIFPVLEAISPSLAGKWATKLFFTPFRFKPPQPEEQRAADARWTRLQVNEDEIQIYQWGAKDAPVALLMHGWSGRGLQFREMIAPLLEEGYQVVTFDAPGHGRSTGKESNIILFKDALLKIQQELGFIHLLIAHSLGGAASWYARVEGLEVGKMVSISTPSIPAQIIQEYLVRINASARTGKALEDHVENLVDRSFESFGAYVNAPLAPAIPTLLFHDLKDKEVSIRHLEKLQEVLPHAKSSLSDGLGHNRILKDAGIIRQIVSFARLEKRQTISA